MFSLDRLDRPCLPALFISSHLLLCVHQHKLLYHASTTGTYPRALFATLPRPNTLANQQLCCSSLGCPGCRDRGLPFWGKGPRHLGFSTTDLLLRCLSVYAFFLLSCIMTSLSDILFPSQDASLASSNNINRILGDLKRSTLSITNRLRSIQQDAAFVDEVRAALGGANKAGRPLVANERCGSWYIRPEVKGGSAYFKSTDGHTGQWRFSTRRLNLHLLPMIERFDG